MFFLGIIVDAAVQRVEMDESVGISASIEKRNSYSATRKPSRWLGLIIAIFF